MRLVIFRKENVNYDISRITKILGDRIEITLNKSLTPEERQTENEQSALVMNLAKQMINNGDLILRTEKLMAQNRSLKNSISMKLVSGDE